MKALAISCLIAIGLLLVGAESIFNEPGDPGVFSEADDPGVFSEANVRHTPEVLGDPQVDICDGWAYENSGGGWCCTWDKPKWPDVKIISRPPNTIACKPPMRFAQGDTVWCCLKP